jgi:hypothetical protein
MECQELTKVLLKQQKKCCFICEKPLDCAIDSIEIDHIIPRSKGGKDDENNFAATHARCNRNKSDSDLRVARCLAKYYKVKEDVGNQIPNRPNLADFLELYKGGKYDLHINRQDLKLTISMPENNNQHYEELIYKDSLSGLEYCFLNLPIEYLHHDNRINPRAVSPRIRGLIIEFLSGKPQLHIALAWGTIEQNRIKVQVFDGQHKVVAQLLLGVRTLPIRLFINPDPNVLLEANTNAGTILRQVAFDQSIQRFLGSQLYWEKIDEYRKFTHRSEEDLSFTEQELVNFFSGQHREVARYIIDDVRISIIYNPENKLRDYIEFSGREGYKPLSYSTIEKTFFSLFIRQTPMQIPMNLNIEVGENPRQLEKMQIVRLANLIASLFYIGSYDFDIGANKVEDKLRRGEPIPDLHLRAVRISREEVLFNILRYVQDLVKQYFLMDGQVIDDVELFQHQFSEILWMMIERLLANITNLPLWINHQISGTVFGAKQDHEYWKIIFATGLDRSGIQVIAKPLNLNELVKE